MSDRRNKLTFSKPFTQQEPIPATAMERVRELLETGRLHRYNLEPDELGETAALEQEYAKWQGCNYALAVTSGGAAMHLALRACGVSHGSKVLCNSWTLAPVPGAIHQTGAEPVFVETNDNWLVDLVDLEEKASTEDVQFFLISHMRGHIADMDAILDICDRHQITLIEDCAHTMGATWKGKPSGNFGAAACFSTQTYKHMNSGEGGFLTSDDPDIMARAIIMSGSYMLYERHGTLPPADVFESIREHMPNLSCRMDHLRACLIRAQLPHLSDNIERWNRLYGAMEEGLRDIPGIRTVSRRNEEKFVGSSIQFHCALEEDKMQAFLSGCGARGIDLKWFGERRPKAFTSRYDSWRYLKDLPQLDQSLKVLSTTLDMRLPLTFNEEDIRTITTIIGEEKRKFAS